MTAGEGGEICTPASEADLQAALGMALPPQPLAGALGLLGGTGDGRAPTALGERRIEPGPGVHPTGGSAAPPAPQAAPDAAAAPFAWMPVASTAALAASSAAAPMEEAVLPDLPADLGMFDAVGDLVLKVDSLTLSVTEHDERCADPSSLWTRPLVVEAGKMHLQLLPAASRRAAQASDAACAALPAGPPAGSS